MSNLAARVLVAVVAVPAILALLYVVPPIGFYILTLAAAIIASLELFGMVAPNDKPSQWIGTLLTVGVSTAVWFAGKDPRTWMTLAIAIPLVGILMPLIRLGDIPSAGLRSATFAFGPLYCAIPLALLAILRRDFDPGFVVLSLMLSWFGDTGGYFAGRFLGKAKLYEAVSPKKTRAGAIGGLLGSVLGAVWASLHFLKGRLPIEHAIPLAIVAGALGQAGDLAESLLKRSVGVKDSGGILPGHGGILDRIDALMFNASTVFLYLLWR